MPTQTRTHTHTLAFNSRFAQFISSFFPTDKALFVLKHIQDKNIRSTLAGVGCKDETGEGEPRKGKEGQGGV
jgi:hypothetical protein